jgi:protein phosphatase
MATEGRVHADKSHVWHMEKCHEIAEASDEMLLATTYKVVDLTDQTSQTEATRSVPRERERDPQANN